MCFWAFAFFLASYGGGVSLAGGAFGAAALQSEFCWGVRGAGQPAPKERRALDQRVAWSDVVLVRAGEMRFKYCEAGRVAGGQGGSSALGAL